MKAFIITSSYEYINNKAIIQLYGRLENGESFQADVASTPYFFIKTKQKESAQKILEAKFEDTTLQTMNKEPVTKISITNPKEITQVRETLENNNIPCFEADISFTRRYLIDKNIKTTINILGEKRSGTYTTAYYKNPTIEPTSNSSAKPKILSFDIETTKNMETILSIAIKQENHEEVIVIKNPAITEKKIPQATAVDTEKEVIEIFLRRIKELDPDIITGWHCIDFDMDVISKRCKHYNIPFILGRGENTTRLRIENSFFRDSKVYCQGRIILDGIQLLKSSFIKLEDYKLNTAAKEFLKDNKLIEENERFEIIENAYHNNPELFISYNLKDADLVLRILKSSKVLELTIQRSLLTGMHMDGVKASIASFDSLYLQKMRSAGYVAPTTRRQERDEGMGGFVMTSQPGLYKRVLVFDFKSLYPSIMCTFNLDPIAYLGQTEDFENEKIKDTKKYIIAPNHAVIKNAQSILPQLLLDLWAERDRAREQGNELSRYAIKIQMNSMYGVLASPNSRFHNRKLSNAITSFGQKFVKLLAEKLEEQGHTVIYGDTDSVFVNIKTESEEDAEKKGRTIEQNMNNFLREYIEKNYNRKSFLELEFEKQFLDFFMPTTRGSTSGAKKRYAGLRRNEQGNIFLDVTGLEIVRSDWTNLAKKFQEELLYKVFEHGNVKKVINEFIKKLKAGELDSLLEYRKSLRKELSAYTKTTPPHVKAARLLETIDSNIIRYYITTDGPQPVEKISAPIDYEHYIDKQLKPIAESLLEVMGEKFDDVTGDTRQTGLGKFM